MNLFFSYNFFLIYACISALANFPLLLYVENTSKLS